MNTNQTPEQIDMTPLWVGVLPLLILGLTSGADEAQKAAREELERMARAADKWNAHVKAKRKSGK